MATCRFSGSEPEVVALCWHQSEKAWTVLFRAYLHGKHAPLAVIFEGGVCICTEMQCASSPSTSQRCRFVDILSGRSDRLNGLGVVSTLLRSRAGGMSGGAARLSVGTGNHFLTGTLDVQSACTITFKSKSITQLQCSGTSASAISS